MNIPLPADLEHRLQPHLSHLSQLCQRALEAIDLEADANRLMSAAEVQVLLQLPSHLATDAFLKQHGAICSLTLEDVQQAFKLLIEFSMIVLSDTAGITGLIDFPTAIAQLQQTSFHVSPTLVQQLLQDYYRNVQRS